MTDLSVRVCMALGDMWWLVLIGFVAGIVVASVGPVVYRTRRR